MNAREPLRLTVFLFIALLVGAGVAAGALLSLRAQRELLVARASERAVAEVRIVSTALQPLIAGGQLDGVRAAFNRTVRDHPEITSAVLANETGKVLLDSGGARAGQRLLDLVPPPATLVARRVMRAGTPPALEVSLPMRLADNREGTLRAEVRLGDLEPDLLPLSLPFAGVGLGLLLVGTLTAMVIIPRGRPLANAQAAVRAPAARLEAVRAVPRLAVNGGVDASREAVVEAARAKSAFLMTMSREMRAPVEHILDHARALATTLTGEPRQHAERALAASEGLLALTSKIGDYLSVAGGTFDDADAALDPYLVVGDVVETLAPIAHRKRIELVWWVENEVPALVLGPGRRVREALAKLVGNAIRFTDHGEVCVVVSRDGVARGGSTLLRFTVSDTGCGVEPSRRDHLFTLAGDATHGLGLLTCKQLVDSMGGAITYAARAQGGSTFAFVVPMRVAPRSGVALPHDEGALRSQRIMIVDDNATSRSVLERQLASWSIPHEAVATGREALTRLRAAVDYGAPYALAIVDAVMPETSGVDLARAIRHEPKLADLAVLLLTAGDDPTPDLIEELRIDAVLTKPVRPARLYTCLAAILLAHMKGSSRLSRAA